METVQTARQREVTCAACHRAWYRKKWRIRRVAGLALVVLACAPRRPPVPDLVAAATTLERQAAAVEALRVEAAPMLQVARAGGVVVCKRGIGCAALPLRRPRARRSVPTTTTSAKAAPLQATNGPSGPAGRP